MSLRIAVEYQISSLAKEAIGQVGAIARDLRHPPAVRMRSDARDLHGTAGDIDEKQHAVCLRVYRASIALQIRMTKPCVALSGAKTRPRFALTLRQQARR